MGSNNNETDVSTVKNVHEMMKMPDGTVADVTGMDAEQKKELLESYKN